MSGSIHSGSTHSSLLSSGESIHLSQENTNIPAVRKKGCCCGFLASEIIVLGVWALIGSAITAIGILGIIGIIPMSFGIGTISLSTVVSGSIVTAGGAVVLVILTYAFCFVCQRRADRAKPMPLGRE